MKLIRNLSDLKLIEDVELRNEMKETLENVLNNLESDEGDDTIHIAFMENEDDFNETSLSTIDIDLDDIECPEYIDNTTTDKGSYSSILILYNNEDGIVLYSDELLMEKYLG